MVEFPPSMALKDYVKTYLVFSTDKDLTSEVFYPSCYIDFAINISSGSVVTIIDGRPVTMPKVEVLGQLTVPTRLSVEKGTVVLIARIYPHAAALFFRNSIADFTNQSLDLKDVIGSTSDALFEKMMKADSIAQKAAVLDAFFLRQMLTSKIPLQKITVLQQMCRQLSFERGSFSIKLLAMQLGLSERYIQKLFTSYIGLPPKTFFQMQRFSQSLSFVQKHDMSLTSIAHHFGYYDQAHFIKEFRKFTGMTPSEVRLNAALLT